jgi:hypothetical protein
MLRYDTIRYNRGRVSNASFIAEGHDEARNMTGKRGHTSQAKASQGDDQDQRNQKRTDSSQPSHCRPREEEGGGGRKGPPQPHHAPSINRFTNRKDRGDSSPREGGAGWSREQADHRRGAYNLLIFTRRTDAQTHRRTDADNR